jgi:hypothetical protein
LATGIVQHWSAEWRHPFRWAPTGSPRPRVQATPQPVSKYVAAGAARATSAPLATLRRVTHSAAGGGLGRTLDVAHYAAPRRATDPDPVARRVPLAPVQAKPIPVRHAVSPNPIRRGRDTAHPAGRRPRSARPHTAMSRRWPLFFLSVVHFSGARRRRSWTAALLIPPPQGGWPAARLGRWDTVTSRRVAVDGRESCWSLSVCRRWTCRSCA